MSESNNCDSDRIYVIDDLPKSNKKLKENKVQAVNILNMDVTKINTVYKMDSIITGTTQDVSRKGSIVQNLHRSDYYRTNNSVTSMRSPHYVDNARENDEEIFSKAVIQFVIDDPEMNFREPELQKDDKNQ